MGEPVYGHVTPDGYPDTNSGWLSNNDLFARFNFAVALMGNNIKGTKVDVNKLLPGFWKRQRFGWSGNARIFDRPAVGRDTGRISKNSWRTCVSGRDDFAADSSACVSDTMDCENSECGR